MFVPELEPEAVGRSLGSGEHGRIVALREEHEPAIVAEVGRQQRGMAIQPEAIETSTPKCLARKSVR